MAKSLRSKWKRKMRAVKRVRYGKKELTRLTDMLTKAGDYQMVSVPEMKDEPSEIDTSSDKTTVTIPDANSEPDVLSFKIREKHRSRSRSRRRGGDASSDDDEQDEEMNDGTEEMAVDKPERKYSKRTLRDQFGNYPEWMNKRKIIVQQKKNKRINKRKAKAAIGKRGKF